MISSSAQTFKIKMQLLKMELFYFKKTRIEKEREKKIIYGDPVTEDPFWKRVLVYSM